VKTIQGIFGLLYKGYVGIVFLVTLLLFYLPILITVQRNRWKKYAFQLHVAWSWAVRLLVFVHVRYKLRSPLPKAPYIIISNHASYLDIFLMNSILPQHPFLFFGKSEILKYPLVKTFFKKFHIPVFRKDTRKAAQAFIHAKKAIQAGWSLVIFPEGTIPDENWPQMIPFKEGAFKMAKNCKVPILPITFANNYKLFSDPECLLGPARPGISEVYIHPAIEVETVQELSTEDLMQLAYDIIDTPLVKEK
jgi:1-acyl-sn-glycerol-3-phosphate acyltransferase